MRLNQSTKVLITGASGSLGWTLSKKLADTCRVMGTYCRNACVPEGSEGVKVDLCDERPMTAVFESFKPDLTVHLAAITDPDRCERNPQLAFKVNYEATMDIARRSKKVGARLVFVSTDLVFDGSKGNYREDETPRPLSIYGMSKLRAEEAALAEGGNVVVLRSSLMYGLGSPARPTFLARVVEALSHGQEMRLFTDQKRNPILVDDVARALIIAVERDVRGLYHIGGSQVLSRYEFGQEVCKVYGYEERLLVPMKMQEFPYDARRPLDPTLNIQRFTNMTGFMPSLVPNGLKIIKDRL